MRIPSPFLSLLLTPCIAFYPIWAQTNSAQPALPAAQSPLQLHVVDDPGHAVANSLSAKGYILQVSDFSGNPVSAAAVALRLPEDNPTGRFSNGLRAWVAYTNAAGIANFPPIQWQDSSGAVELRATAAKASMHAGLLIQLQIQPSRPVPAALAPASPTVVPVAPAPIVKPPQPATVTPAPVLTPAIPTSAVTPTPKAAAPLPAVTPAAKPALPLIAAAPVAQPSAPPTPKITLPAAGPNAVSKPLADVVPPKVSKSGAEPASPALTPNPPVPSQDKTVSIVNMKTGAGSGHLNKKWLIIGAVGAGAAVGVLLAVKGHGGAGTSTASTATLSIGAPTISVGH